MTVTFCGHKDTYDDSSIRCWLTETVECLIQRGADLFFRYPSICPITLLF